MSVLLNPFIVTPPSPLVAPTVINSFPDGAGTSNFSLAMPTGHETGDLLLIYVVRHALAPADLSGWTRFIHLNSGSGDHQHKVFWKIAASSSEPSVTITAGNPSASLAYSMAARGVDQANPIGPIATWEVGATGPGSWTLPEITTLTAANRVVGYAGSGTDAASGTSDPWNNWLFGGLTDLTEHIDRVHASGGGGGMGVATGVRASAGATGTGSVDHNFADAGVRVAATFAIRPEGAP